MHGAPQRQQCSLQTGSITQLLNAWSRLDNAVGGLRYAPCALVLRALSSNHLSTGGSVRSRSSAHGRRRVVRTTLCSEARYVSKQHIRHLLGWQHTLYRSCCLSVASAKAYEQSGWMHHALHGRPFCWSNACCLQPPGLGFAALQTLGPTRY